jgi:hypothetical protein
MLNDKILELVTDKGHVYQEMNKMNLILSGIPDCLSETGDQLSLKVKSFLNPIVRNHIEVDVAYRLGNYTPDNNRRVKIRLLKMSDRNSVWSARENTTHPHYINEDLSFNMRQAHSRLRQQKRKFLAKNPTANTWIDWRKLTINHGVKPAAERVESHRRGEDRPH